MSLSDEKRCHSGGYLVPFLVAVPITRQTPARLPLAHPYLKHGLIASCHFLSAVANKAKHQDIFFLSHGNAERTSAAVTVPR